MLDEQTKIDIVTKHQKHARDVGSSKVQIALMSAKIEYLARHLQMHKKDKHSRRGLIGIISQRRKLIRYLRRSDTSFTLQDLNNV